MFDRIEFRGVRWKKEKSAPGILGSKKQPLFGMKWSIIHYNYGSLFQRRQKLAGKPKLKKPTVHRPVIMKRCKNSLTYLSSDNATALILSSTNLSEHSLTPQRIPIFPIQVCIYTAFIHISDLFQRYIFDLFLICRYLLLILLLIADRLFFLVILCRRNASRMPLSLHPNASAIWLVCVWVGRNICLQFFWIDLSETSMQIFLFPIPRFFQLLFHFCIVDLETLKTWWVASKLCPACRYSIVRSLYLFE